MTTYPLPLKAVAQQNDIPHTFRVVEGDTDGNGFEHISTWLQLSRTKKTTYRCGACGAVFEMPDGSLEAHLKKYQAEHGGNDAIVRIIYAHHGPRPATLPPGIVVVTDKTKRRSLKEVLQMQENSQQDSDSSQENSQRDTL